MHKKTATNGGLGFVMPAGIIQGFLPGPDRRAKARGFRLGHGQDARGFEIGKAVFTSAKRPLSFWAKGTWSARGRRSP